MVLQNYVILEQNIPARIHVVDHMIQPRDIFDPLAGRTMTKKTLVLVVDELNGGKVNALYSTLSEKHALQFEPYFDGKRYQSVDFVITKRGVDFRTEYQVEVIPRRG